MRSIQVKRIYEAPSPGDGSRILVDRLWPRGISKESAQIAYWAKDVAPSSELRKWYGHDPTKWEEFRARYFEELETNPTGVSELLSHVGDGPVTFLFSSKEMLRNNAHALQEYVSKVLDGEAA